MTASDTTQTEHAKEPPAHLTGGLTRTMWRDDGDPVAQTAKAYERVIRNMNKAQEIPPWYQRVGAYIAGGLVGALPGAAVFMFTKSKTKTAEMIGHITTTAGIVAGVDIADSFLEVPHINRQKHETAQYLDEARNQARTSYTQSITEQKAGAEHGVHR